MSITLKSLAGTPPTVSYTHLDELGFLFLVFFVPIVWYKIFVNRPPIFANIFSERSVVEVLSLIHILAACFFEINVIYIVIACGLIGVGSAYIGRKKGNA